MEICISVIINYNIIINCAFINIEIKVYLMVDFFCVQSLILVFKIFQNISLYT